MKTINKFVMSFTIVALLVLIISIYRINVYAASSDTKIKKIEVTPCINNIEQDSDNSNIYRVSVNNSVSSVNVKVEPNNPNASISVEGNTALDVGTNRINITVTAEDGTSASYIIYARRLSKEISETTITPNVQTEEKKFDKPTEQGIQPADTTPVENETENEEENITEDEIDAVEEENIVVEDLENKTAKWENNDIDESTKNTIIIIVIVVALIALMYSVTRKKQNYKKKH